MIVSCVLIDQNLSCDYFHQIFILFCFSFSFFFTSVIYVLLLRMPEQMDPFALWLPFVENVIIFIVINWLIAKTALKFFFFYTQSPSRYSEYVRFLSSILLVELCCIGKAIWWFSQVYFRYEYFYLWIFNISLRFKKFWRKFEYRKHFLTEISKAHTTQYQ